jgi:hypothetical protein
MVIRVNDLPHHLTLLLFVREAWSLAGDMDIPPLEPAPDLGRSQIPDSADAATWDGRWKTAWDQAWRWYEIEDRDHHPTPAEMRDSQDPSQGLNPFIPPFWTQQYEWEGLDHEAYQAWEERLIPRFPQDAEPGSLQELIPAWKNGIDTIIVLPYRGYFARRLSRQHLVISADTRNSPADYSRALRESTR